MPLSRPALERAVIMFDQLHQRALDDPAEELFDMSVWTSSTPYYADFDASQLIDASPAGLFALAVECHTSACAAGWIVLADDPFHTYTEERISERAMELLKHGSLDHHEVKQLFSLFTADMFDCDISYVTVGMIADVFRHLLEHSHLPDVAVDPYGGWHLIASPGRYQFTIV